MLDNGRFLPIALPGSAMHYFFPVPQHAPAFLPYVYLPHCLTLRRGANTCCYLPPLVTPVRINRDVLH